MINGYGREFINIEGHFVERGLSFVAATSPGPGLDVGPFFNDMAERAAEGGIMLYLPPGRYFLPYRDPGLPSVAVPQPSLRTRYELPENVQLYLCQGALLRPEEHVDLIIRGSLRAGRYQVFGYERGRVPRGITGVNTVPKGRVLLWTRRVPAVYPEWWGAFSPVRSDGISATNGLDSSDALQAAIDAACVHRDDPVDGVRRPSIPVVLGSMYQCNRTLRVARPAGTSSLQLILRGPDGLGGPGSGIPTLLRLAPDPAARLDGCALHLGPGVDFDIQDVYFSMSPGAPASGCVDIACDATETAPRRGLFRRCTLIGGPSFALRVVAESGAARRHFVLDACVVSPANTDYLTVRGVEVRGDASVMLHLDGGLMGAVTLGATVTNFRTPALPSNASIHLTGGSVLARAVQFHNASGPRPSRGNATEVDSVDLGNPDGQEVFLATQANSTPATATHFTAVHCECQGWWFLSRPRRGHEQVALVNVAHGNVNWEDPNNIARYLYRADGARPSNSNTTGKAPPPSVVWLKEDGQCLLVGCRFDVTVLTDTNALGSLTDVATAFQYVPQVRQNLLGQQFRPDHIPASMIRPPSYELQPIDADQAFDFRIDHVVPIAGI